MKKEEVLINSLSIDIDPLVHVLSPDNYGENLLTAPLAEPVHVRVEDENPDGFKPFTFAGRIHKSDRKKLKIVCDNPMFYELFKGKVESLADGELLLFANCNRMNVYEIMRTLASKNS